MISLVATVMTIEMPIKDNSFKHGNSSAKFEQKQFNWLVWEF